MYNKQLQKKSSNFINNKCFLIIEHDDWKFRVDKWRKENTPSNAHLVKKYNVVKNVDIELWEESAR